MTIYDAGYDPMINYGQNWTKLLETNGSQHTTTIDNINNYKYLLLGVWNYNNSKRYQFYFLGFVPVGLFKEVAYCVYDTTNNYANGIRGCIYDTATAEFKWKSDTQIETSCANSGYYPTIYGIR